MIAHVILIHPDAPTAKKSIEAPTREEIDIGFLKAIREYAKEHGVDWKEVTHVLGKLH